MMKITLDLPDSLMKEVKLRAIHEGERLTDAVADLLRKGLASEGERTAIRPRITTDRKTRLPRIESQHAAPGDEMTPDRVAEILSAQEAEWHHAAHR